MVDTLKHSSHHILKVESLLLVNCIAFTYTGMGEREEANIMCHKEALSGRRGNLAEANFDYLIGITTDDGQTCRRHAKETALGIPLLQLICYARPPAHRFAMLQSP